MLSGDRCYSNALVGVDSRMAHLRLPTNGTVFWRVITVSCAPCHSIATTLNGVGHTAYHGIDVALPLVRMGPTSQRYETRPCVSMPCPFGTHHGTGMSLPGR